jgi:putative tricarboxylic transport membrane protein
MQFRSQALRRRTFSAALLVAATGIGAAALAQSPIELKLIAPAAPGGGWDGASRSLQQVMNATGAAKNVQVVNVPGAGAPSGWPSSSTRRRATAAR